MLKIKRKRTVAVLVEYSFSGGNMSSENWVVNVNGERHSGGEFRSQGYESLIEQLVRLGVHVLRNESGYE